MGMVLSSEDWASLIEKLLGYQFTVNDFAKAGERLYNLARVYSIREGLTRADDTLPARFLEEPMPEGPAKGQTVNLDPLLNAYYEYRGWDKETGKPTKEKLTELGLEWTIKEIY
jgi:aldehyde:ferredoxin oxidoreductase